ncbi:hypothetical protein MRX96_058640 [Rhipicephalus microplus]
MRWGEIEGSVTHGNRFATDTACDQQARLGGPFSAAGLFLGRLQNAALVHGTAAVRDCNGYCRHLDFLASRLHCAKVQFSISSLRPSRQDLVRCAPHEEAQ